MSGKAEMRMDGKSYDNVKARIDELKRLFPEAVKEGRFDPELLVGLLEENDETYGLNDERYDFTWKGKAEALRLAQRRSDGTLRPCFEESRDWDTTQNLYIEGDNLEVMKLLQQGYLRSVKMIYIDPPYNTGNDFVYQDDFADPIAKYKEATGQGMRANPETAGRYHSNWLSMMYPRLKIAKTLLRDDGVMFISIDDNEVHNLRKLCDEVFGEENFVTQIEWQKRYTRSNNTDNFTTVVEHICVYARTPAFQVNLLERDEEANARFTNPDNDPRGPWKATPFLNQVPPGKRPNLCYPIENPYTKTIANPTSKAWRYEKEKYNELLKENRLWWGVNKDREVPDIKTFLSEVRQGMTPINLWQHDYAGNTDEANREIKELFNLKIFDTPKPSKLLVRMIEHSCSGDDDIVMDFFSGSAPLAQAVFQYNLSHKARFKFILCQIGESTQPNSEAFRNQMKTIAAIGKERIRRAGDNTIEEWREKVSDQDGKLPLGDSEVSTSPPDIGFRVFKLDSSNLTKWDGSYVPPEEADLFLSRAEHSLANMKPDRRDIDMVYEVLLKYGVPLTERLATLQIRDKTFYVVGDTGYLMICLESGITVEIVEDLIKTHTPGAVIFADQCFADDNELTNAGLALDKAQIEFRWI